METKSAARNLSKGPSIREHSEVISFKVEPAPLEISKDAPQIELALQFEGQNLSVKANWTTAQLLEFITAWRAL